MKHTSETLAVLAFLLVVTLVYAETVVILYRRYLKQPAVPFNPWTRAVLVLAGAGALCFLYGRFIEPRWIEVTSSKVVSKHLPAGHRGVRIVHLTDLHCDPAPLVEVRLPGIVADLKPDLIVFTGDAANEEAGVPIFRTLMTELAKIAPTFAVKGNWDAWYFPHVPRFTDTGVIEVESQTVKVDVGGTPIRIVGAGYETPEAVARVLNDLPPDGPAIVLYHCPYPDIVPREHASRVDLMCAGHVHGGQVALPIWGALLTLSKFGKRFESGLYPDADGFGFPLYVGRGIGMEGGSMPRVRFWARPEVALIELVPAGS